MREAHACEQLAQVCCSDGRKSNPRVHRPNHCTTISHGAQTALPVFTQRYLDRFIHFPGLAVVTETHTDTQLGRARHIGNNNPHLKACSQHEKWTELNFSMNSRIEIHVVQNWPSTSRPSFAAANQYKIQSWRWRAWPMTALCMLIGSCSGHFRSVQFSSAHLSLSAVNKPFATYAMRPNNARMMAQACMSRVLEVTTWRSLGDGYYPQP